jgi:hypothetical protein
MQGFYPEKKVFEKQGESRADKKPKNGYKIAEFRKVEFKAFVKILIIQHGGMLKTNSNSIVQLN